jgi:hypothetical protein
MKPTTAQTTDCGKLPVGCTVLDTSGPFEPVIDIDLAFDLARLGASETLVRSIGGEEAVHLVRDYKIQRRMGSQGWTLQPQRLWSAITRRNNKWFLEGA